MFIISVIFIFILLTLWHLKIKHRLDKMANIPGPRSFPIFGQFFSFVGLKLDDVVKLILNMIHEYGLTYKINAFNEIVVVMADPQDIQELLSSSKYIEKNYLYDLLLSWLNTGLLTSSGSKWHNRRKIITPAFHFNILEQFIKIFEQQSTVLVEKMNNFCDQSQKQEAIDIHRFIAPATLDIIAETAMGIKINAQTETNCAYVTAISTITKTIAKRFIKMWLRNDLQCFLFKNSLWHKQQNAIKFLHNFTENIIVERRNLLLTNQINLANKNDNNLDDLGIGQKKRLAFLDVLLQSTVNGKPLTNLDIREEVDTFMFEGHDTTTTALCFTLTALSRHRDIQNKIIDEILHVIGIEEMERITYQNLQDLKYMDLVIKESLRMFPPVAVIGRKINEEVIINNKIFPARTQIIVHLQGLMSNPKVFKDPQTFIPERFLNILDYQQINFNDDFNPYTYIPFSAGPRNCIGQKFAMLELKMVLTKVLMNFELLALGPEVQPSMDIILRSKTGFHLGLRKRKFLT